MKIPNAEHAVIVEAKLRDYLLSPTHPIGRFKAVFFANLGYTQESWSRLAQDLREQHLPQDATLGELTQYGQKYEIRATLQGPADRIANTTSVWIIENDQTVPRLVTAYPSPE